MGLESRETPVMAKVALVDPATMSVLWLNESAKKDLSDDASAAMPGVPLVDGLPLAETLGLPAALNAVAQDGAPRHLHTDLVSTAKGSMSIATSVYRLPDGQLLVVTENAWSADRRGARR